MSSIQKSPKVLAQEERIAVLEKEISKVKKVIKSLKTRLEKTQASFEQTQRDIFNKTTSALETFMKKTNAVLEALTKVLKKKKLPFHYREMLTMIKEEISSQLEMGGMQEAFEVPEEFKNEKAESRDIFEEFRVEPPKDEKKNIRQLYLHLSKKFHPDKATTETEAERFKTIQQHLVQAYQMNDLHALEELSVWYGVENKTTRANNTDDLQQEIDQKERQLTSLVAQKERLSEEIKRFRKSDMGKMLTEFDAMKRQGESPLAAIDAMKPVLEEMEEMIAILEKVNKTNRFELLEDLMPESSPMDDDLFGSFLDMLDDEKTQDFSPRENKNAKFKKDSWVKIHLDRRMLMNYFELDRLKLKKPLVLEGQVSESVLDPVYGDPVYVVFLTVESIEALPREVLDETFYQSRFGVLTVHEENISKGRRPSTTRLKHQLRDYNQLWMLHAFAEEPAEVRKIIAQIVNESTKDKPIHLVVDAFLAEIFSRYPTIKTLDYFSRYSSRKPIKVKLSYVPFTFRDGYTVNVERGMNFIVERVEDLMVSHEHYPELYESLDAFAIWEEMYLETYRHISDGR